MKNSDFQAQLQSIREKKSKSIILPDEHRLSGKHNIYFVGDEDAPSTVSDPSKASIGDWIESDDGVIAQVLEVKIHRRTRSIITAFGIDNVKHGESRPHLWLLRGRKYFWSYSNDPKKDVNRRRTLGLFEKAFLYKLLITGDWLKAYEEAYGKKIVTKDSLYVAKAKVKAIFSIPGAERYMQKTIKEVLESKNMTEETWLGRLVDQAQGPIATPTDLNIHLLVGKFIPAIREELEGKGNGKEPRALFPTKEAQFTEVCPTCNDTKEIETTSIDSGQRVRVPCPTCIRLLPENNSPKLKIPT